MSDEAATAPVVDAPESASAPEVAPEAPEVAEAEGQEPTPEVEAPELDPIEVQPEPLEVTPEPVPDTVEVELNGLKYSVPAALKDGYMMHGDYTLKTQELAGKGRELDDSRESLKSDREAFVQQTQTHRENIGDYGELAHTDKLLEGFRKVDFQQLQRDDPDQAQQLGFQFNMLRDTRQQIADRIQQREYDTRVVSEREQAQVGRDHANRRDQLKANLARDIPNYSPELHGQMDQTAVRSGFTQAEIDSVTDPRMFRVLHLAQLGEQVLQRKRDATAAPAPTPVKPTPKVKGGSSPKPGVHDGLEIGEWMLRERQRLDKLATG